MYKVEEILDKRIEPKTSNLSPYHRKISISYQVGRL